MRSSGMRVLVALGFFALFALTAACGGSAPQAKAPGGDGADASRVGSPAPDLTGDTASASTTSASTTSSASSTTAGTPEPPKTTAVSSTDNGSDIIPPFSAGKDPATKKATPTKGSKKTAGKKPKKKAAGA